jgi:YVTN family beta-propeller protein
MTSNDTISVIDGSNNRLISDIPVAHAPFRISIDPSRDVIYVVNIDAHRISVIDGKTDRMMLICHMDQQVGTGLNQ